MFSKGFTEMSKNLYITHITFIKSLSPKCILKNPLEMELYCILLDLIHKKKKKARSKTYAIYLNMHPHITIEQIYANAETENSFML